VTFHPATLLLGWVAFVAVVQSMSIASLGWVAVVVVPLCLLSARRRTLQLVRRARWLLLSIVVLFALATPGQRVPGSLGDLGLTIDGLLLAAEHAVRLLLLLATLALVHERLGTAGFMAGLHWLLAPLAGWRTLRERIVVRLMLVLDYVETAPLGDWRAWLVADMPGPDKLHLAVRPARSVDWAMIVLLLCASIAAMGWLA
jgi:hypothetical protein